MIAIAALRREESRGGHMRLDFPQHDESRDFPRDLTIDEALDTASALAPEFAA
jgi:L-aspartate oxidase